MTVYLVTPLSLTVQHRRNRHPHCVEELPAREVDASIDWF
jgi:hypothetical protein